MKQSIIKVQDRDQNLAKLINMGSVARPIDFDHTTNNNFLRSDDQIFACLFRLEEMIRDFSKSAETLQKIAIPLSDGWDFIHMDDILYLKAEGNYTHIQFTNGKNTLVARTLKSYDEMLSFDQYFRSHQSYLVNINHVNKFFRGSGGYLHLDNGDKIPVARSKRDSLSRKMGL